MVFEGDTGEFVVFQTRSGEHTGNTIDSWLRALHRAQVFGLPYKIFVCFLGLVVAMLSATGAYIWWKKRQARRFRKSAAVDADVRADPIPASELMKCCGVFHKVECVTHAGVFRMI